MRLVEFIYKNSLTEYANPLFPDRSVKMFVDPNTGLYLKSTKQALQDKSAYVGAVWRDNNGKFSAQMHITNSAKDAINNSSILSKAIKEGKLPESLVDVNGKNRPTISFGYFNDERQAAYALQKIRFSGKHDDYVVEYLIEKLNNNLKLPWHEAIDGMPEFEGTPINYKTYNENDYQKIEKQQTQQSNIESWLQKNKEILKKKLTKSGYSKLAVDKIVANFQELNELFRQEIEGNKNWPKIVNQINLPEVYALTWFLNNNRWLTDNRLKDLISKYSSSK